jgi:DNA polymerase-1
MHTIDFETMPIEARPVYPPRPVCVSIKHDNAKPTYHYGEADMKRALSPIFKGKGEMLFHNSAFDVAVAVEKLGLPMPSWRRTHDTQFMTFLLSPFEKTGLKPTAERVLRIGLEDQTELEQWIRSHVPEAKNKRVKWEAYIGYAPEKLLKKRAHGDTNRTWALYNKLLPQLQKAGMVQAYERERRLMPVLTKNSREGIRVNARKLKLDTALYEKALLKADDLTCKMLRRKVNLDSPAQLIWAIEKAKMGGNWHKTAGGDASASRASLLDGITHAPLMSLLGWRSRLETMLSTFLRNWCDTVSKTGDRLHTDWRQVAARTARLSSSPNFQNIPKMLRVDIIKGLPPMPNMREYFLPDEGDIWVRRDFSQQELRILAHMTGGKMKDFYIKDPKADLHQFAADSLAHLDLMRPVAMTRMNRYDTPRGVSKHVSFSILYGMGDKELAYRLGVELSEAKTVRREYLALWPDLKGLLDELKFRAKLEKPYTTWGGRKYLCEPPRFIAKTGRVQSFEYKMINYLIQGSAADYTKESLCVVHEAGLKSRFLATVHDENNYSVPRGNWKAAADEIGVLMCSPKLDVPMLSDLEYGERWGDFKKSS